MRVNVKDMIFWEKDKVPAICRKEPEVYMGLDENDNLVEISVDVNNNIEQEVLEARMALQASNMESIDDNLVKSLIDNEYHIAWDIYEYIQTDWNEFNEDESYTMKHPIGNASGITVNFDNLSIKELRGRINVSENATSTESLVMLLSPIIKMDKSMIERMHIADFGKIIQHKSFLGLLNLRRR